MILKPITNGSVAGVVTVNCESKKLGAVLLTADGTNAASVKIQETDANGTVVFQFSSIPTIFAKGPFQSSVSQLYCTISGTGGKAQLYEWVD